MLGVVPVSLPSREMPEAALAARTAGLRADNVFCSRGGERIPGTRDDCRRAAAMALAVEEPAAAAAAAATVGALKTLVVGDAEADDDGDEESVVECRFWWC